MLISFRDFTHPPYSYFSGRTRRHCKPGTESEDGLTDRQPEKISAPSELKFCLSDKMNKNNKTVPVP